MAYAATVRQQRFVFADLRELLAKANEEKSGDQLAEIAATSEAERVAAKWALADVTLREIVDRPVIDPDDDDVSASNLQHRDLHGWPAMAGWTVGEFRDHLLGDDADEATRRSWQRAITPEIAAAVAKIMSHKDLIMAASRFRNITHCRNTQGQAGVFGIRLQPNHPRDDLAGIVLATLEGLQFGCGDAVIGVNPATESVSTVAAILHTLQQVIARLQIPTQSCCLAHVSTQWEAMKQGAPVDLMFQSIAGTEATNRSFGISAALLQDAAQAVQEHHRQRDVNWVGSQCLYFETGQGSALSAGGHHGVDQLTLEARAYGLARQLDPFLVNSVVGFIGPEYLANERQIIRAGLEDHFCGKLLGLPMGCDVCYTNHTDADQNSAESLLVLLAAAGCNYVMAVPGSDDVMLNYQSTSYHDAVAMRRLFGRTAAPEFERWLQQHGLSSQGGVSQRLQERVRQQWLTAFSQEMPLLTGSIGQTARQDTPPLPPAAADALVVAE
jgi:ethanolamine ammonia-lyase large subunit